MHMRRNLLPAGVLILLIVSALSGCLSFDDYDGDGIYDDDDPDDDNDGMPDEWERANGLESKNESDAGVDLDGDGLSNVEEYENGTDPNDGDTDGDLMPDGWEVEYGLQATNATDAAQDSDGDGLSALEEFRNSTMPNVTDTDGDGMPDGFEVDGGLLPLDPSDAVMDPDLDDLDNAGEHAAGTDPQEEDTDGDLMPDGWEVEEGTDPLVDDADADPDDDGWDANWDLEVSGEERFTNLEEFMNGTDPQDGDTDGDGMSDGFEALFELDPLDGSDADGDPDGDGLTSLKEFRAGTSPVSDDTDSDGLDDLFERTWGLNPLSAVDASGDLDGDGLDNLGEYGAGTNVSNPDTDGDGFLDGVDQVPLRDVALRIRVTHVTFGGMEEGQLDNIGLEEPYELYIRVVAAGVEAWSEFNVTMSTDLDTDLFVIVDIPDDVRNVSISIGLWENDTLESAGFNADDELDVDGATDGLPCDIVYDMLSVSWKGDTTTGTSDGHADGQPPDAEHPDAVITFSIEVVPAPA